MEQAIVLLLGPLPGLLIAVIMTFTIRNEFVVHAVDEQLPWIDRMLMEMRGALSFINAFNLIPLVPLDGGRLVQQLIAGRNAWLMFLFVLISSIGMVAFGVLINAWILSLFGLFGMIGLLVTAKRTLVAANARKRLAGMSVDLSSLSDRDCRILDFLARKVIPEAKTQ